MEFKKGDKVRIGDDGQLLPFADRIAENMRLTKWEEGYGLWEDEEDEGVCQNKTGVIINTDFDVSFDRIAGVELDSEDTQIIINVKGLELLQEQSTPDPVQESKRSKKNGIQKGR
jgi:hypothetical protein